MKQTLNLAGSPVTVHLAQQRALSRNVHESGLENVRTLGRANGIARNGNREADLLETRTRESVTLTERHVKPDGTSADEGPALSSNEGEMTSNLEGAPRNGSSESGSLTFQEHQGPIFFEATPTRGKDQGQAQVGEPCKDPFVDQYQRSVDQQAQMMADAAQTAEAIRRIYDEMWTEVAKSQADRMALLLKTATEVHDLMRQCHTSRMQTWEAHNKAFLEMLTSA